MSKLKSRKLWAWIVWTIITVLILLVSPDNFTVALPWFGGVTMMFIGGQSAIDFMGKMKGKE